MPSKKIKPRNIDIFGTPFVLPKGIRKELNKANPKLKGKALTASDLTKVRSAIKTRKGECI
ncbi:MAG: hypothetical protein ABIC95_06045 [archaeon]